MRYLEAKNLKFTISGTQLQLTVAGVGSFADVEIRRAFPHSHPDRYLSVGDGRKEIGVLRTLDELDPESKSAVDRELARRYFTPTIEKVNVLKQTMERMVWDVVTDRGRVTFQTKGLQDCLTEIGGRLILTDMIGNRYYLRSGVLQSL